MGNLYLVATPIGNLEDITIRAIKTLFSVDGVICEDTRKTGLLLRELRKRYPDYAQPSNGEKYQRMLSFYEQNELQRIPEVITALKNGLNLALVSDAGTPLISDPGFKLVRECIKRKINVISVPGVSAVISSLILSGFPTDKFLFLGYPPRKEGNRRKYFLQAKDSQKSIMSTMIFFEAPHKIRRTLGEIRDIFGNIPIVLCRELTKIHEEIRHELIAEAIEHFEKHEPKGEFVILINTNVEQFFKN